MNNQQVLDLFVDQNVLQKAQADDVLTEAQQNGKTIVQAMVDGGFMDEAGFYHTMAEGIGAEFIDLNDREIASRGCEDRSGGPGPFTSRAAGRTCRWHFAGRFGRSARTEHGGRSALRSGTRHRSRGRAGRTDRRPNQDILRQRHLQHGGGAQAARRSGRADAIAGEGDGATGAEAEANATPIIRFVDLILYQAIQDRASDIHFEPFENEFKIRYRVDGALYEMAPPPRHLALPVISRVKVMANMNIAERRLPQDGRIQKNIAGRDVDLRVSTLPTQFGESVVLRVLDRTTVNLDLEMLGMPKYVCDYILEVIERPNGIFIVTGPTGSGKTTTLYSCLRKINTHRFQSYSRRKSRSNTIWKASCRCR